MKTAKKKGQKCRKTVKGIGKLTKMSKNREKLTQNFQK